MISLVVITAVLCCVGCEIVGLHLGLEKASLGHGTNSVVPVIPIP